MAPQGGCKGPGCRFASFSAALTYPEPPQGSWLALSLQAIQLVRVAPVLCIDRRNKAVYRMRGVPLAAIQKPLHQFGFRLPAHGAVNPCLATDGGNLYAIPVNDTPRAARVP